MYTTIILTDMSATCMRMTSIYACRGLTCMCISVICVYTTVIYMHMIPICAHEGVGCSVGSVKCGGKDVARGCMNDKVALNLYALFITLTAFSVSAMRRSS